MAAWQRGQSSDNDDTLKSIEPTSVHTLNVPTALHEIHSVNINPSLSELDFETQIDTSWYKTESDGTCITDAKAADLAFHVCREVQNKSSGWRKFYETISTEDSEQTTVGYLQLILAPAHEYDTLNTVIRRCMTICGQQYTVLITAQLTRARF